MLLKKVFGIVLFLMSFSVLADSYPNVTTTTYSYAGTTYATAALSCSALATFYGWNSMFSAGYHMVVTNQSPTQNKCALVRNSDGATTDYQMTTQAITTSCPNGGTLSGSTCINAPACLSPMQRLTVSPYSCYTPNECPFPKIDLGAGCVDNTCPVGQVRNIISNVCQTPPSCASTEHYDNSTNSCVLNTLNCPAHSHASPTNDACKPDAPLACPTGQHDDGTYTCVADDATHCGKDKQSGYVNGVKTCISAPPSDTAQKAAEAKAATAQAAIDASNADSTNQGLANVANNQSNSGLLAQGNAQDALLASLANSANDSENRAKERTATVGGDKCNQPPSCSGDPIQCAILKQQFQNSCRSIDDPKLSEEQATGNKSAISGVFTTGIGADMGTGAFNGQGYASTSFWNLSSSSCQTVPMHYKALNYDFDPCTKLELFRNMLGWFFYVFTAFSIVKLAGEVK